MIRFARSNRPNPVRFVTVRCATAGTKPCPPLMRSSMWRLPGSALPVIGCALAVRWGVEHVVLPVMIPDLHALRPADVDRVLSCPSVGISEQVQQGLRRDD